MLYQIKTARYFYCWDGKAIEILFPTEMILLKSFLFYRCLKWNLDDEDQIQGSSDEAAGQNQSVMNLCT